MREAVSCGGWAASHPTCAALLLPAIPPLSVTPLLLYPDATVALPRPRSGQIGTQRFTAHPKTDPETGEMYAFAYSVEKQPYCWFGVLDKEGRVAREMPVPLPEVGARAGAAAGSVAAAPSPPQLPCTASGLPLWALCCACWWWRVPVVAYAAAAADCTACAAGLTPPTLPPTSPPTQLQPIMMHDCALTRNYLLLLDVPLVFDPKVGPGQPGAVHSSLARPAVSSSAHAHAGDAASLLTCHRTGTVTVGADRHEMRAQAPPPCTDPPRLHGCRS